MSYTDTHIQVCLSVTQVLNVCMKNKMDQSANFSNHQIFPLQPKFCIRFFKTTPFKRFPFFWMLLQELIFQGKKHFMAEDQF